MNSSHFGIVINSPLERLEVRAALLEDALSTARARCIALADELAKVKAAEPIDQLYNRATIAELVRKLNDRDQSLAASRARAAALQKRVSDAVGKVDGIRLALGEMVS